MYFYGNGPMGQLSNEFKAGRPSFFLFPSTKKTYSISHQETLFANSAGILLLNSQEPTSSHIHVLCFKMCNNIKIPVPIIELQNQFETIITVIITIFYLQIKSLPMLDALWKIGKNKGHPHQHGIIFRISNNLIKKRSNPIGIRNIP